MRNLLQSSPFNESALFAGRAFDFQPTLVFNENGGLITDAELILDNDVVYVSETEEKSPEALSQGEQNHIFFDFQSWDADNLHGVIDS
jgi:hypothetical protein